MRLSSQKGMTMVELVAATAIGILLTTGVFSFASFFNLAQHEYQSNIQLTNEARMVLEKMVWGQNITGQANRRGIAEAAEGDIVTPTQFDYEDRDGVDHSIRLNNGSVEYQYGATGWRTLMDANGSAVNDPGLYSVSLRFTQPNVPNSVNIEVVVGKRVLSKWFYGSASTQVFYRNT